MKVYHAIAAVMAEIGTDGISKNRKNQQQGYNFRGIDEVYNALSPILSKHKLCILPRILAREVLERQTKSGGALFYVTVEAEFDLVCAEDGSKHTIRTFGEAMDSADKATNKAMSAAYKYAAMQAFCIPTEGDNDADATSYEVAPADTPTKPSASPVETPKTFNSYLTSLTSAKTLGEAQAAFAIIWKSDLSSEDKTTLQAAYEAQKVRIATPDFSGLEA
jgi:hypothetical protein